MHIKISFLRIDIFIPNKTVLEITSSAPTARYFNDLITSRTLTVLEITSSAPTAR